jgi:hypothetical protein
MSWKLEAHRERLDPKTISAILELVSSSKDNQMRFKDVHLGLVASGFTTPSNQRKTSLYLKRLVEKGVLEVLPTGAYSVKVAVKDYEAFAYLAWLRDQYGNRGLTQSFGVGGFTWRESRGIIVPFVGTPTKLDEYLLSELETQLSSIFVALRDLRDKILLHDSGYEAGYTQAVMRQGLLSMVTNVINREDIGNRAVHDYLSRLHAKGRAGKADSYQKMTMKFLDKSVKSQLDLWKRVLYDIHGENSADLEEDLWVSMLRRNGESMQGVEKIIRSEKADLKKAGFDVDNLSLSELKKRKQDFDRATVEKMGPPEESADMSGYVFTPEEQELSGNLDTAIGIKWVEAFLSKGVDWEDFAVLVTIPPEIMSMYNTTLHDLRDKVKEWKALTVIDDELLRYFAHQILVRDLTMLRRPGVASILGLTEDQLDKVIRYWQEFREQWKENSQRASGNDWLFGDTRPEFELSKEKQALLLADLGRLAKEVKEQEA